MMCLYAYLWLNTEEERQSLCCGHEEDASTDNHHDLLLEILLLVCKLLIHSVVYSTEQAEETNWKQKFQKPKNENICLTNLNVENK
jgi:hypothetical protein